ncbi:MAG: hypothetical protein ACRDD1_18940, partial [Planctomycetia bacterium]
MAAKVSVVFLFDLKEGAAAGLNALLTIGRKFTDAQREATFRLTRKATDSISSKRHAEAATTLRMHDLGVIGSADSIAKVGDHGWKEGAAAFRKNEAAAYEGVVFLGGHVPSVYGLPAVVP